MSEPIDYTAEVRELRRGIRDLAALSALPAIWPESDAERTVDSLAEVLLGMLRLDFVYICISYKNSPSKIEVGRISGHPSRSAESQQLGQSLAPWLDHRGMAAIPIPHPLTGEPVLTAVMRIGAADEGVLIAGKRRTGFPNPIERLLLSNGMNQAAVLLQRKIASDAREQTFAMERRLGDQLRRMFEQAPGFMVILRGPQHVFELANAAFSHLVGDRNLIGKPLLEVLPEVAEQRFPRLLDEVYATGKPFVGSGMAVVLQREQGVAPEQRYIDFVHQPLIEADGSISGVFVEGTDVTERKRVEQALIRSEERLTLLWESAQILLAAQNPDVMLKALFAKVVIAVEVDAYFNFMADASDSSLRLRSYVGISAAEAQRIDLAAFDQSVCNTVVPAQAARVAIATHVQNSHDPLTEAIREYGISAYACYPLMAGERLMGTLSFGSRKRDHFANDDLDFLRTISRYVAVAYERLQLIDGLRDAHRRKDEFIATLAHELRNPLAPIRQAAQIARAPGATEEKLRWSYDVIDRQVQHMALLLEDLLDVSRITRGTLALRKKRADLRSIIDAALETARPLIDARNHRVSLELPDSSMHIEADTLRLAQVVANLLTNAAKYTEPNGSIQLSARFENETLVLVVADTGVGIEPEMLTRVFEMFSQVKSVIDRAEGGLGIGLALVKGLVALHGGTVEAQSAGIGRGSQFTVRLPRGIPHEATTPESETTTLNGSSVVPRKILVADDNRDAADSLAIYLGLLGHGVQTAHDGNDALRRAESFRPDVVLLDIGMPSLNGYEVAKQIRSQTWGTQTILIAVTGWGQESDKQRAREAGFNYHLTKPLNPERLIELLSVVR